MKYKYLGLGITESTVTYQVMNYLPLCSLRWAPASSQQWFRHIHHPGHGGRYVRSTTVRWARMWRGQIHRLLELRRKSMNVPEVVDQNTTSGVTRRLPESTSLANLQQVQWAMQPTDAQNTHLCLHWVKNWSVLHLWTAHFLAVMATRPASHRSHIVVAQFSST